MAPAPWQRWRRPWSGGGTHRGVYPSSVVGRGHGVRRGGGGGTHGGVAQQEGRALQPRRQHLVGVPGHRVGPRERGVWGGGDTSSETPPPVWGESLSPWGCVEPIVGGESLASRCPRGGAGARGRAERCRPRLPAGHREWGVSSRGHPGDSQGTGRTPAGGRGGGVIPPPAPVLTSTWSQRPWRWQRSAMGPSGSKAPRTVVPQVAQTRKGSAPWGGTQGQGQWDGGQGRGDRDSRTQGQ